MSSWWLCMSEDGDLAVMASKRDELSEETKAKFCGTWHLTGDRRHLYYSLLEASASGANPERVENLRTRCSMDGEDCLRFAKHDGITFQWSGNSVDAVKGEVKGTGSSEWDALVNLFKNARTKSLN